MSLTSSLPLMAVFCGVGGFILTIAQLLREDSRIARRVRQSSQRSPLATESDSPADSSSNRWAPRRLGEAIATLWLRKEHQSVRLRQRLLHAGYSHPSAVVAFVSLQLLLMLLLTVAGGWMAHRWVPRIDWQLAAMFGAGLGFLLPGGWVHRRRLQRQRMLNRALPDLLDLIVSCLDAGQTLEAVIQRICKEDVIAADSLVTELQGVQREIELGASADQALRNLAERNDSEELRAISVVCLQARKYGARISETLRAHADRMREQREQAAEEAAQKAAVRILAPTLLCLFPVIFIVLAAPAAIQINENLGATSQQEQPTAQ